MQRHGNRTTSSSYFLSQWNKYQSTVIRTFTRTYNTHGKHVDRRATMVRLTTSGAVWECGGLVSYADQEASQCDTTQQVNRSDTTAVLITIVVCSSTVSIGCMHSSVSHYRDICGSIIRFRYIGYLITTVCSASLLLWQSHPLFLFRIAIIAMRVGW